MAELIKIPDKTNFTTRLGDMPCAKADVKLLSACNINAYKWATPEKPFGEAFVNLNFPDLYINDKTTDFSKGLIEVVQGDMKFSSWVLNEGVLEYSIGFSSCPTKFNLEFDLLDSGNLSYYYQRPLTQEDIDSGTERPPNVEGSYAVYFNRSWNKYCTGKFKHLYRWEATDADGKKAWCDILIEYVTGIANKFIVQLPVDFMRSAKYPVFAMGAGDTIGFDSEGGTYGNTGQEAVTSDTADGGDGDITQINFYVKNNDQAARELKGCVYETTGGEPSDLLAETAALNKGIGSGGGLGTEALTGSITDGNTYWVGLHKEARTITSVAYDDVSPAEPTRQATGYAGWPTIDDPWPGSTIYSKEKKQSVWVDYTPAAGGLSIPIAQYYYRSQQ